MCPQNGTGVLKGLSSCFTAAGLLLYLLSVRWTSTGGGAGAAAAAAGAEDDVDEERIVRHGL